MLYMKRRPFNLRRYLAFFARYRNRRYFAQKLHNNQFRCVCIAISIEHRSRGHTAEITGGSRVTRRTTRVLNRTGAQ